MCCHTLVCGPHVYTSNHTWETPAVYAQDWSCTATTVSLFDWFKLEDIRTSLYWVLDRGFGREQRCLGGCQPRYLKFLQVGASGGAS